MLDIGVVENGNSRHTRRLSYLWREAPKKMTDKQQLNEGMASINVEEEIDVSRIKKLAGLANNDASSTGTPVDESVGMMEEKQLQQLLTMIETSITKTNGYFKRYVETYEKLKDRMSEEEQMHYGYGIQAMFDLIEDMRDELVKHT